MLAEIGLVFLAYEQEPMTRFDVCPDDQALASCRA
jgi:hypothetical protein